MLPRSLLSNHKCAVTELIFTKPKLISEITHSDKTTPVLALRNRLFPNVGAAQFIRRVFTSAMKNLFHFRIKQPAWRGETMKAFVQQSKTKIYRQAFPIHVKGPIVDI